MKKKIRRDSMRVIQKRRRFREALILQCLLDYGEDVRVGALIRQIKAAGLWPSEKGALAEIEIMKVVADCKTALGIGCDDDGLCGNDESDHTGTSDDKTRSNAADGEWRSENGARFWMN